MNVTNYGYRGVTNRHFPAFLNHIRYSSLSTPILDHYFKQVNVTMTLKSYIDMGNRKIGRK